jgi:hypothetical protein
MAIRPLHLRPVPRADELLDARGDVWRQLTYSTDRYASLWENTRTETGATWAVLDSGAYGRVVVLPTVQAVA